MLRPLVIALACTIPLVLTGCGGGSSDSDKPGVTVSAATKEAFVSKCGGCHTLDDAGTSGSSGPQLDGRNFDAERVSDQIENGGGGMPSGLLEGKEREAVAEYVAKASD